MSASILDVALSRLMQIDHAAAAAAAAVGDHEIHDYDAGPMRVAGARMFQKSVLRATVARLRGYSATNQPYSQGMIMSAESRIESRDSNEGPGMK